MSKVIELILSIIFTSGLIFGSGYCLKKAHDFVRKKVLTQVSKSLSSSAELSKSLTKKKRQ